MEEIGIGNYKCLFYRLFGTLPKRAGHVTFPSPFAGLNVEVVDKGVNGVPVKSVTRGSAVHRDGSIKAGDYIVSVNNETMRNVTQAQAKAVLRRCQLISTDIT